MKLVDKVAIITGAAQGIGYATAEKLIDEGATVVIADFNEEKGLQSAKKLGGHVSFQKLNVADEDNWERVFKAVVDQFGYVDILVNSAGITGGSADVEHETLDDWDKVFDVNAKGSFLGVKHAMLNMKNGGAIVNVVSMAGAYAEPVAVAYSASKGAERMLTKSAALYGATKEKPVRVNSVLPAATNTEMVKEISSLQPEVMQKQLEKIPLKKFAEPEDMANMIAFLVSDEAKFITGGDFMIDGGQSAGF
ncbi:glucose 1-dehydrogenase [Lactobacillaceae bacterium 24-114]